MNQLGHREQICQVRQICEKRCQALNLSKAKLREGNLARSEDLALIFLGSPTLFLEAFHAVRFDAAPLKLRL